MYAGGILTGILSLWYILTGLSLVFVIWDQCVNTPSLGVMKLAWVLVILYTGPVGLFMYFTSCRQPLPDTHDAFIAPHWKQAFGSEIHCVAGDATAIIIAAGILHYFNLPNGLESIIEYVSAYIFGLLIFQALFMISMFSGYWEAVRKTIFAETVSMNMVMAGMIPTVLVLKHIFPEGGDPFTGLFWGIMSAATLVGFVFAYPINSWMVKKKLKHGMMSRPQAEMKHEPTKERQEMRQMQHHEMPHHHEAGSISLAKSFWVTIGTFAFLFAVVWIVSIWVPIKF